MVILNRGGITTCLYSQDGFVYASSELKIDEERYLKLTQCCPLHIAVPRVFLQGAARSSFSHNRGLYRFLHQKNLDSMRAHPSVGLGPS
ncbi:hypothetical protein EDF76_0944 [Raoultella terrigena]|nr:hypothetical protein EDF76_0944 [Raoultella terrigena]